jgi:outer membrane protein assembly factor BamA
LMSTKKTVFYYLKVTSQLFLILVLLPTSYGLSEIKKEAPKLKINTDRIGQMESPYDGMIIRSITIHIDPIFGGIRGKKDENGTFYRAVNSLKMSTKERVISRDLLFTEGSRYDEFTIWETKRNLRRFNFLRTVEIETIPDKDVVDVHVYVQDSWTFVPQFSASNSGGSKSVQFGVGETNLFGLGKTINFTQSEVENRQATDFEWYDPRVAGSFKSLRAGLSDRNDGRQVLFSLEKPFRSLLNNSAWKIEGEDSSIVGRMFNNGTEDYIYRIDEQIFHSRYTFAFGDPEILLRRITLGFDIIRQRFSQATEEDFESLGLDPAEVSNSSDRLATDRIFHGLVIGYRSISQDFIPINYVDRFDRVEDYNLGAERSLTFFFAPDFLGSEGNTLESSFNRSGGLRLGEKEFLRAEIGGSTRTDGTDFKNSLIRGEMRYYKVLGDLEYGDIFLGRHTLAFNSVLELGDSFDADRQLYVGSREGSLRGYDARAFAGDKRFIVNLEDRIHLYDDIAKLFSLGFASFVDLGSATTGDALDMFGQKTYADAGFGFRIGFPRSSGGGVVRLDIALPLRDGPDGTKRLEPRIVVTAGQAFDARLRTEVSGTEESNSNLGFTR